MRSNTTIDARDRSNRPSRTAVSAADSEANPGKSAEEIADIYAGLAAKTDRWAWLDRIYPGPLRRRQFGDVDGRVLDVACGTGRNFRYLPASADLVGIDISEDMLARARTNLDELGRAGTLHRMDAQDLAFPDDSFDAVVSAFSTCTFPDPVAGLREMARVCKPGGEIRLLEHGQSNVGPIARILDWRADGHYRKMGCRLNQEPLEVVREAGLPIEDARETFFGMITAIDVTPEGRA